MLSTTRACDEAVDQTSVRSPARRRAAIPCREQPDLWFSDDPSMIECAKRRCRTCPLVAGCLTGALDRREPWGVWGGELLVRGSVVARKRGRGRPRKDEAA